MCGDIIVWLGAQQINKLNVNVVLVYGPFLTYEWAVLDVAVGRFGPRYGPFLPFAWAVLIHGPFWYRPILSDNKNCNALLLDSETRDNIAVADILRCRYVGPSLGLIYMHAARAGSRDSWTLMSTVESMLLLLLLNWLFSWLKVNYY